MAEALALRGRSLTGLTLFDRSSNIYLYTPPGCFLIGVNIGNIMNKIINYIKETKAEMDNVKWPSRKQAINFTIAVIVVSVLVAYYLGFFDLIFKQGLEQIINQ